jgi:hypothetical protein
MTSPVPSVRIRLRSEAEEDRANTEIPTRKIHAIRIKINALFITSPIDLYYNRFPEIFEKTLPSADETINGISASGLWDEFFEYGILRLHSIKFVHMIQ